MTDVAVREALFRMLAGNQVARAIAEHALALEDEEEGKRARSQVPQLGGGNQVLYPWMGFEWFHIPAQPAKLNQLVIDGLLVTGGPRGTYRSRSATTYKLKDPELIRECLEAMGEIAEGSEEGEIPTDLFDFIIGHDDVKDVLFRSLQAERPVHIMLVGPPATAKSMFLGELARLPFSRFALGGSTRKGGLEDYLLEFRPRYLILDEIDKMDMRDMSVLLSLMENGIVARLKKRMREIERMNTWIFAGANRDDHIWPELKSRFFTIHLTEYTEADFMQIARAVLITREKVETDLANHVVKSLARHTRDVREAIHFGRLCKSPEDVDRLLRLKWPGLMLF